MEVETNFGWGSSLLPSLRLMIKMVDLTHKRSVLTKTAMTCTYPRSPYPRPCAYAHPTPDPVPVEILLRIYTQHRKQGRPSPNSHDATLPLIFPFPSVPSLPLPALPYSPFPSSPSPLLSLSLLSHPSFPWT